MASKRRGKTCKFDALDYLSHLGWIIPHSMLQERNMSASRLQRLTPEKGLPGRLQHPCKLLHNCVKTDDYDTLKWLLKFDEALDHVNHELDGLTPLMLAAKRGHFNCAKALLWVGASILPKDAEGSKAPWILAREENHKELGNYLEQAHQQSCLTGMCRDHCAYLIYKMCKKRKLQDEELECLRPMLHQFGGGLLNEDNLMDNEPPLIVACKSCNEDAVHCLITEFKADIYVRDRDEQSTLHLAIQAGMGVRFLITDYAPALLVAPDGKRRLPFFTACLANDWKYVKWLFGKLKVSERLTSTSSMQVLEETSISSSYGSGEGVPVSDCYSDSRPLPAVQLTSELDANADYSLDTCPLDPTMMKNGEGQYLKQSHSRDFISTLEECGDNHPLTSPPLSSEAGRSSQSSLELNDVSLDVCPSPYLSQSESSDNVCQLLDSLGSSKTDLVNFIQSIDICKTDINEETVFHVLAQNGNHRLLKLILAQAKAFGFKVSPQVFVQFSSPSKGTYTPLHCAVRNNHPGCIEVMLSEIVGTLRDESNPALTDELRKLRLMDVAVVRQHIPALRVLVQYGWWYELKDKELCARSFTGPVDGTLLVMALYAIVTHLQALATGPSSQPASSSCISWEEMALPHMNNPLLLPVVTEMLQYGDMLVAEHTQGSISERLDDPLFLCHIGTKCVQTVDKIRNAGPDVLPLEQYAALTHITQICLSQNKLESVPFELFALPNLDTLSLSHNHLKHLPTGPSSVNAMELLEDLNAEGAPHVKHYQCHKLRELHVSHNELDTLPPNLFQLCNLETLDASHNSLTYLPLQLWVAPKLKTLQLQHNQLSQLYCLSHEFQVNCALMMDLALYHWCGEVSPRLERLIHEENSRLARKAEESMESESSLTATYLPSPTDSAETPKSAASTPEDLPNKRRSWFMGKFRRPHSGTSFSDQLEEIVQPSNADDSNGDCQNSLGANSVSPDGLFQQVLPLREEGPLEVSSSSTSAAFPKSLFSWNASKKVKEFCQFLREAIGGDTLESVDGSQVASGTADFSAEEDHLLTNTHGSTGGGLLTMFRQQQLLRTASQSTNRETNSGSSLDERQGQQDDFPSLPSGTTKGETLHSKPIPPLESLDLSHNHFCMVPWDLICLAPSLEKVNFSYNRITKVNCVNDFPSRVKVINLSHNEIQDAMEDKHRKERCVCGHFVMQLLKRILQQEPFACDCEHRQHTSLPWLTKLNLSHNMLHFFPVASEDYAEGKAEERVEVVFMPNLSILDLSHNMSMRCVSSSINKLSLLLQLSLSFTNLTSLPTQLGLCSKLLVVDLDNVVSNLPPYLQKAYLPPRGSVKKLCQVLKDSHVNSKPYHCIRLMVVGDSNKGKTTLVMNLSKKYLVQRQKKLRLDLDDRPLSTEGVDILDWEYRKGGKSQTTVTFYTWDFGGQKEYYATHQVFFSKRSLYLLVFDVSDGEEGIYGLKRWLENIEAKASGSQVMVVGTHFDTIPGPQRAETRERLKSLFAKEYLGQVKETMSLRVDPHLRLVNTLDSVDVQSVRDAIYDCALSSCPSLSKSGEHGRMSARCEEGSNLSEFRVPALYIEMERIVKNLADLYRKDRRVPILNRETFVSAILKGHTQYDEYDVHQGTFFLHDNGILLHFPEASLSDLYFIDPQWLSTVLARVISIPELRRYHRNGFMKTSALDMIFANDPVLSRKHYQDIISLMQKFEVALILDEQQILIPTLLPQDEYDAQGVYPKGGIEGSNNTDVEDSLANKDVSVVEIASAATWRDTRVRHFIVPFVPNGFFPRLVARIIASGLALRLSNCLAKDQLSDQHASNSLHWYCWCQGFTLVWRHTEILRITQVSYNLPGTKNMTLLGYMSREKPAVNCAIEVEVAMLPKDVFCNDNFLQGRESILQKLQPDMKELTDEHSMGWQMAAWLLNTVTEQTQSVFEDWYPQFAWGKESGKASVLLADLCPSCLAEIRPARIDYQQSQKKPPNQVVGSIGSQPCDKQPDLKAQNDEDRTVNCFALTYSAYASSCGENLVCQQHGSIPVGRVAPDVEFKDIYYKPVSSYCTVKKTTKLGEGAYGSVYLGIINTQNMCLKVAIKELMGGAGPDVMAESEEDRQWTIYKNASTEARIMSELKHPHVLGLVGLTLHPWCLLLEYAPEGDLKRHIKQYAASQLHFGQRILLQVMEQIASAVDYLHSKNIIYRDLKPSNVLAWKFPKPFNQWKEDAEVLLKIADYGISKRGTPWGTTGCAGTPAFQPPEAQIHRPGMELFITSKFDVYSYGLVLYCIYSGKNPFENYRGPITSVVSSGFRPDVLIKDIPRLQGMFELMCWCWGQKPQHRPPFREILEVMQRPLFHRLLLAEEVSTKNHTVTAACFRQMAPSTRLGHRRLASGSNLLSETEFRKSCFLDGDGEQRHHTRTTAPRTALAIPRSSHRRISEPVLDVAGASLPTRLHRMQVSETDVNKVLSSFNLDKLKPRAEKEEGKSQLWFATANGSICVKDCIKGKVETVAPVRTMVRSMLVVQDQVWCGFLTSGIRVFHADTHRCIAKGAHKKTITQLLYNPDLRGVHAFTDEGEIMNFGDLAGLPNQAELNGGPVDLPSEGVAPIEIRYPLECAVLVPCKDGPEIWCYVQAIRQILVLDPITLFLKSTFTVRGKITQKRTVQPAFKMIYIEAEEKDLAHKKETSSYVLLLDQTRVVKFCTEEGSHVTMDMHDCLAQGIPAEKEGVECLTSLEKVGKYVYAGSTSGVIWSIDPKEMQVRSEAIQPFRSRVSCLLSVKGIGKKHNQEVDYVEWRERAGLAAYPLRGLQQSEEYLVAFGEDYQPVYHDSAFKPLRTQLLVPQLLEADELPVGDSLSSLSSSSKVQRSVSVSNDNHCHMVVVDVKSPHHF